MPQAWQSLTLCDTIAAQSICDDRARLVFQTDQQAFEEAFGGCGVPALPYQDVQHDTVLVNSAPEITELVIDLQVHLIEVLNVGRRLRS